MSDVTLEQVWQLVEQLNPKDRDALMGRLQAHRSFRLTKPITLAAIMAERKHRVSTSESVSGLPSLRNAYADPQFNLNDEQLRDGIKDFASEWEQELDDYRPED
jgi:hypothetical protein